MMKSPDRSAAGATKTGGTSSFVPGAPLPEHIGDLLRDGLAQAIPFNLHNGVEIREVAIGYGVARIPDADFLKNHLGTQHGAALFAVAEAAAGAAYIGAFLDHLGEIRMNAQEAHVSFLRWARGQITARSAIRGRPEVILDELRRSAHLDLEMSSELQDGSGERVGLIDFRFHLKAVDGTTRDSST